ncbi:MAG: hypothetical protein ACRDZ8_18350 [Acidimicrobiales bacterium]
MASDDEFRRVAEDVRALARSLGRDLRAAFDQAHDEFNRSGGVRNASFRAARDDLAEMGRTARREFRQARGGYRRSSSPYVFRDAPPPNPADRLDIGPDGEDADEWLGRPPAAVRECPPRFDGWGGGRYRSRRASAWGGGRSRAGFPSTQTTGWANHESAVGVLPTEERPVRAAKTPPPPLRHRHDSSTLLGLLAVVFGLAGLAAATGVAHVSGEIVAAVALMVLGAAMVVTARTDWALSRHRWPIFGGVVLGVALVVFAVVPALPVGFRHVRFGSSSNGYTSWAQVPPTIQAGGGRNIIDLSGIETPLSGPQMLSVANGVGTVVIELPTSQRVQLHASVVAGSIEVNGVNASGLGRVVDQTFGPNSGATLSLQVKAGFGRVVVDQTPFGTITAKPVPTIPTGAITAKPVPTLPTVPLPGQVPQKP